MGLAAAERVAAREHRLGAGKARFPARHVPAEGVGEAGDHVEERAHVDGVDQCAVGDAGVAHPLGVCGGELVGPQGQLLEEAERGAELLVDGSGAPVALDCLPDVVTERIRRDRGVGVRSEGALLEVRHPAGEELALAGRPVGLTAHCELERVGERPPEDLRPVVERLQDAARFGAALLADPVEDDLVLRAVAGVDGGKPQRHARPRSRR